MAQYKVPQNVEADDKLLGPFTFRQFVYLLIAGGLVALTVILFRVFPLLAIIPLPPLILFVVLALPLKKDQPMETYLAAIVSYYLKPRTRLWTPGQRETVIKITAPKIVDDNRTRDISGEEAGHRLSFLADIVDTGGYAIKGTGNGIMREDLMAEASTVEDMFEGYHFSDLNNTIQKDETERHAEVVREMQEAIDADNKFVSTNAKVKKRFEDLSPSPAVQKANSGEAERATNNEQVKAEVTQDESVPVAVTSQGVTPWNISAEKYNSPVVVMPGLTNEVDKKADEQEKSENVDTKPPKPSIIELANNTDYTIETIAKEAKRINEREGEVFIALH